MPFSFRALECPGRSVALFLVSSSFQRSVEAVLRETGVATPGGQQPNKHSVLRNSGQTYW